MPAGWTLTSATCSDGSAPSAIALAAGETVTCTFVNRRQTGALRIYKTRKHAASGPGSHPHAAPRHSMFGPQVMPQPPQFARSEEPSISHPVSSRSSQSRSGGAQAHCPVLQMAPADALSGNTTRSNEELVRSRSCHVAMLSIIAWALARSSRDNPQTVSLFQGLRL